MLKKSLIFWFIFIPDVLILYASLWLAVLIRYPNGLSSEAWGAHLSAFTVLHVLWILVFFIHGLFEAPAFRRYTTVISGLVSAMTVNGLLAVLYFYLQPNLILTPRRFLILDLGLVLGLILVWHLIVKYFLKNTLTQSVYLFSFNKELEDLEKEIQNHSYMGFRVLGHLDEAALKKLQPSKEAGIILPGNLQTRPEVLQQFYEFRKAGVNFYDHRSFYERLLRKIYLSQINELWFLENINYQEKRFYTLLKRSVDLVLGSLGFIVFVASYPLIALLIKLFSKGPVLFVQERVGKNGKLFKVYKYRTMSGGATNTWTSVNDPRITTFGRFLRKSRLDEIPQFLNLVLGNMSLVGPRPEQSHIVENLKKEIAFYDERHLVKPGITGWAQLNIYASTVEETRLKLQYDLYYIKHRSILFDLEIILKTIYYIFTWKGR